MKAAGAMAERGRAIRAALDAMTENAPRGTVCGINGCDRPCMVMRIDGRAVAVCWGCKASMGRRGGLRLAEVAALFQYAVTMDDPTDGDPLGGAGLRADER